MQCLRRTLRGIGSQLACNRTTHVGFSKVFACPEVFTLVPNLLSSGGGRTTNIFQESAGHPEQYSFLLPPILSTNTQEKKLRISRELRVPNIWISQYDTIGNNASFRGMITACDHEPSSEKGSAAATPDAGQPQRIKFKRLDKTAKHIMNILDKEAVDKVQTEKEIPDIKPGYIIQLKVEVPENKRRISTLKGIVIARRNAGLHSTFRLRRLVAGVGVESVFPLYSPNIKEMKVLDKKNVRRAKLYYLRDRMNALKK